MSTIITLDAEAEADLNDLAGEAIDELLGYWANSTITAINQLTPPSMDNDITTAPAALLSFGFNLANHVYPHVAPEKLPPDLRRSVDVALRKGGLPIFLLAETQKFIAETHRDKIHSINNLIKTDFNDIKRQLRDHVRDTALHFPNKNRSTRDAFEAMVAFICSDDGIRSDFSENRKNKQHVKSVMQNKLEAEGLMEYKEDQITPRINNAFRPIKEKIEIIASHSPAMNYWVSNYVFNTQYRLLWASRGADNSDVPDYDPSIINCSERTQCGGSDWCIVDNQDLARRLMVNCFQYEVKDLGSHPDSIGTTSPMGGNIRTTKRAAVMNNMPNRDLSDLLPSVTPLEP